MGYVEGDRVESNRFIGWTGTFVGRATHPDPARDRTGPWCLVRWDASYAESLIRLADISPVGE
jgi:hypothetical protein